MLIDAGLKHLGDRYCYNVIPAILTSSIFSCCQFVSSRRQFGTKLQAKSQKNKSSSATSFFDGFSVTDDPLGISRMILHEEEYSRNQNCKRKKHGSVLEEGIDLDPIRDSMKKELRNFQVKIEEVKIDKTAHVGIEKLNIKPIKTWRKKNMEDGDGDEKSLEELALITITSGTQFLVKCFDIKDVLAVRQGLIEHNKHFLISDEGRGLLKVNIPKVTRELREGCAETVKELFADYTELIEEIAKETEFDIKQKLALPEWHMREIKNLRDIVADAISDGKVAVQKKLKTLLMNEQQ